MLELHTKHDLCTLPCRAVRPPLGRPAGLGVAPPGTALLVDAPHLFLMSMEWELGPKHTGRGRVARRWPGSLSLVPFDALFHRRCTSTLGIFQGGGSPTFTGVDVELWEP